LVPVKKRKPAGLADERDKIVTTTLPRASRIYARRGMIQSRHS